MIGATSKIIIPEKPCGINRTQVDCLRLLTSSSSSKVASLKISSIPTMQHSNSIIFILSNVKISYFSTLVLSEMSIFVKCDYPTLYRVLSQFHFTTTTWYCVPKSWYRPPPPLYNSLVFLAFSHLLHHFPIELSSETKFFLSRVVGPPLIIVCSPLWCIPVRKSDLSCLGPRNLVFRSNLGIFD